MPRKLRVTPAGYCYHIWNRAAGRVRIFRKESDYLAFEKVMLQAHERTPLPLLDWVLMPNHWHFVVRPTSDRQVTEFFRWLTHTHAMRVRAYQSNVGFGPLYQGRFKSLPVETGPHLRTLLRYVERNPVRAKLTTSALKWRWGSAYIRKHGPEPMRALLAPWPVDPPRDWSKWVDTPQSPSEVEAIRECAMRTRPIGEPAWVTKTAAKLGMDSTLRAIGRPRKLEGA